MFTTYGRKQISDVEFDEYEFCAKRVRDDRLARLMNRLSSTRPSAWPSWNYPLDIQA
jgi:hypothetical protein